MCLSFETPNTLWVKLVPMHHSSVKSWSEHLKSRHVYHACKLPSLQTSLRWIQRTRRLKWDGVSRKWIETASKIFSPSMDYNLFKELITLYVVCDRKESTLCNFGRIGCASFCIPCLRLKKILRAIWSQTYPKTWGSLEIRMKCWSI